MAKLVITLKVMPETAEVDLRKVEEGAKKEIESFGGEFGKSEIEPIAFGLNALKIVFIWEESKGGVDALEEKISKIEGVMSAQATDVRRAVG